MAGHTAISVARGLKIRRNAGVGSSQSIKGAPTSILGKLRDATAPGAGTKF
jgi:hypothetical protein